MTDLEKAAEARSSESQQFSRESNYYGSDDPSPPYSRDAETIFQAHEEPPPTYDSLYGKIKATKREATSPVDFFKQLFIIILGTIGCTISLALLLAIPISYTTIGSIYLYQCPRQRYIPIYLIVAGVFGIVKCLSDLVQRAKNKRDNADDRNAKPNPFDGILNLFLFAWFIAGNVWIYSIYRDFQPKDPTLGNYCNYTLYYFAFWMTTAVYIVMLTMCFCFCCTGLICGLVAGRD